MWLTNGVHVVDRLNWVMASQALSVSAVVGTRAHYQAADDSATAFIRYKSGLAGIAVAVGYAGGGPMHDCVVIGANASLRFDERGMLQLGKGEKWTDVAYEPPPTNMTEQWRAFAQAITLNIEPPTHGEWGRHVMEILFAAEESSLTGREVVLESGPRWRSQTSGTPVATQHGWI